MSIEIIPTGAALGAEIRGVDLAQPIDDATFAAIERAYDEHGVIFFRDQHITPAATGRLHPPLRRNRIQHLRRTLERAGQPRNRRSVQHHRRRPADRHPPRRRELAQRHVLRGPAAARHHALRASKFPISLACRSAIPNSPAPLRPGTHCPAPMQATDRRPARDLRLQRPQACLPAHPGGDRSLSAGPTSDRPDASSHRRANVCT